MTDPATHTAKDPVFFDLILSEIENGNSFFIYNSDTVDSLASCCRLRSAINTSSNTFAYTLGGTGIATGSKKVFTLNINRLVQLKRDIPLEVAKLHKYLVAFNEILYEEQAAGILPVYDAGYISLDKQYLTIGVNGIVEAAEFLGFDISDNPGYKLWLKDLLGSIRDANQSGAQLYSSQFKRKIMFNTEFVPAEGLGPRFAKKDRETGLVVPRDCYNSYLYRVEDDKLDIFDKFNLYGREILDNLDGGSAYHINLDSNPDAGTWRRIIEYAIKVGCNYFCWNVKSTVCEACGYIDKRTLKSCSKCGSSNISYATRVIGYLKKISSFSEPRQHEAGLRYYHKASVHPAHPTRDS